MKNKRKLVTLIISYTAAAFAVIIGIACLNHAKAESYQRQIENTKQHAFRELSEALNQMDASLKKSVYATSPSMVTYMCTDVYGKSIAAQIAIGELPFSNYELEHTASFISKVGDYALSLSKNASSGELKTDEELNNLKQLSEYTEILSQNIVGYLSEIESGTLTISELNRSEHALSENDNKNAPGYLVDSFMKMEEEFPEIPSLIYDGPFSNHIEQMEPELIKDEKEISEEIAVKTAGEFLNISPDEIISNGVRECDLPVYMLSANDGEIYIEVTKQGGKILYMKNTTPSMSSVIEAEDCVKIAKRFLEKQGYENMSESYYTVSDNEVTANFSYKDEDVTCYSDLIKVTVSCENGKITGFESLGYIMSHTDRNYPEIKFSEEDARSNLSSDLSVISSGKAMIPTSGKNEVHCHEHKCETEDGRHFIVYTNTQNGNQEKILILLEDENGTLTI